MHRVPSLSLNALTVLAKRYIKIVSETIATDNERKPSGPRERHIRVFSVPEQRCRAEETHSDLPHTGIGLLLYVGEHSRDPPLETF